MELGREEGLGYLFCQFTQSMQEKVITVLFLSGTLSLVKLRSGA